MKLSTQGRAFIREWEGLRLKTYLDSAGLPTIGYGHLLLKGESYPNGISKAKAIELFDQDAVDKETAVTHLVRVSLLPHEFDALVSLVYNIGVGAFGKSTLLKKLNSGDFLGASQEFPRWNKAGGKVVAGLTRRRVAEQKLFTKGLYS